MINTEISNSVIPTMVPAVTPAMASMSSLVIEKEKLLSILKENKEKHDAVFEIACDGYWEAAKQKIAAKEKEFKNAIKKVKKLFKSKINSEKQKLTNKKALSSGTGCYLDYQNEFDIDFPESFSEYYEKAIKVIELSVHNTVILNNEEVNQYLFNNWTWKNKFLEGTVSYCSTAVVKAQDLNVLRRNYSDNKYIDELIKVKGDVNKVF